MFAQKLREHRKAIGLTQEQLADRAGLSRGTIRGLEGMRSEPSTATLMRLVAVRELKLDLDSLPSPPRAGSPREVTLPMLPRTRTCPTRASGTSGQSFAARRRLECTTIAGGSGKRFSS